MSDRSPEGFLSGRVAIVFHRSDIVGGASKYALALGNRLTELGADVEFFLPGYGAYTDLLDESGLRWSAIPSLDRSLNPMAGARACFQIERALRAFKPDLLSAQASTAGVLCRIVGPRLGVPVIYTPHSWSFATGAPTVERLAGLAVERAFRKRSAMVIAVSRFEAVLGLEQGAAEPDRIRVIHNGVEDVLPQVVRRPATKGPLRVVNVARFEAQKDPCTLIRAFAELGDVNAELHLVGDGPLLTEVMSLIEQVGLTDRVIVHGAVGNVGGLLRDADLFVLSSRWESLPLSIIEAMQAGLPVVATDVGGVGELVVDGSTGSLVPSQMPKALAVAMKELLLDQNRRLAMGREGRTRYLAQFTSDRMFGPTIDLYREVGGLDRSADHVSVDLLGNAAA